MNSLYPFEVIVAGTPISLQASGGSRQRWKDTVKKAAQGQAQQTDVLGFLYPCPVELTIYYFAPAIMTGDIDNIVKPIMDALIGVAYFDDQYVERVVVQKFEPGTIREVSAMSGQLALALDTTPPVIYIRVIDDLSWRTVA